MRGVSYSARAPGWWWPLRHHRRSLLWGGMPAAVAVAILFALLEPVFESRALIEVKVPSQIQNAVLAQPTSLGAAPLQHSAQLLHAEFMNTQREIVASSAVAGVWRESLRVEVVPQTHILAVHYQAHGPQLARQGADSIVNAYVDFTARSQVEQISEATALLMKKLDWVVGAPALRLRDVGIVEEPFTGLPDSAELPLVALEDSGSLSRLLGTTLVQTAVESYDQSFANLTSARVIDPANLPQQPLQGPHPFWILLGYFIAVAVPAGVLVARFHWRNTLDFDQDVPRQLGLPCLGSLPFVQIGPEQPAGTDDAFTGAINGLRNAVQLLRPPRETLEQFPRGRIILVTSGSKGEGKTMLAVNLALALGRMEKVLLIDADMRANRSCAGLPIGAPGLSHLIAGAAQLRDCVHSQVDKGIDVIPAGIMPPHPHELLASKRFRRVLDTLERRYGAIVIDAPALDDARDTLQLARHCSDLLFVAAAGTTTVADARGHLAQMRENGVQVSGVVLNRMSFNSETLAYIAKASLPNLTHGM